MVNEKYLILFFTDARKFLSFSCFLCVNFFVYVTKIRRVNQLEQQNMKKYSKSQSLEPLTNEELNIEPIPYAELKEDFLTPDQVAEFKREG